ncbi:hypothetical protein O9929_13090 [Vibrio lentus]|nr:hypothetical protein [Vibrio lentus]
MDGGSQKIPQRMVAAMIPMRRLDFMVSAWPSRPDALAVSGADIRHETMFAHPNGIHFVRSATSMDSILLWFRRYLRLKRFSCRARSNPQVIDAVKFSVPITLNMKGDRSCII